MDYSKTSNYYNASVYIWLLTLTIMVLLIIVIGGLTRLTDSGLSMTDWRPILGVIPPMNLESWITVFEMYKQTPEFKIVNKNMTLDEFKYIFWWEWFHRIFARAIGIVFIIPLVYFAFTKKIQSSLYTRLGIVFAFGLFQAVIGWWMVKSGLTENPIYDIPSRPVVTGQELTNELLKQIKPFNPHFHLNQQVDKISKSEFGWVVETSVGTKVEAKCIVIAAGAGSFVPRKPPIENIENFENKNVFYAIRDKSFFKGKKLLIAGGGDSALDWTNELSKDCNVTLIHRRKEFRAAPDSVSKMQDLEGKGKINFLKGQIKKIIDKENKKITIQYENEENISEIEVDYLLPFFGLKMELGPIADWGLNLNENLIKVDTEKFETSTPSIFAIGDINWYPGKLKLILSGFHESALMAQEVFKYCFPDKKNIFRYTTSSKELQKKLGV